MPVAPPDPFKPFSIAVVPDPAQVAVMPIGELDAATVNELELEMRELRDAGFTEILLDLRRVTFMDSTGLRLLIALRNDAAQAGHHLTLRPGPDLVQRVFALTETRGLFDWRLGHASISVSEPASRRPTAA